MAVGAGGLPVIVVVLTLGTEQWALGDRLQAVETTIARSAADVRRAAERQTDTIRR